MQHLERRGVRKGELEPQDSFCWAMMEENPLSICPMKSFTFLYHKNFIFILALPFLFYYFCIMNACRKLTRVSYKASNHSTEPFGVN